MHQKHWTFAQSEAASTWQVNNIPEGATGAVITHIEADDGQILQPDNQIKAPYGLQLSFGVQAVAGTAYGEYYVEETQHDSTTTVSGDGGVINVTVHQNNGVPSSQP